MTVKSEELIQDLIDRTSRNIHQAKEFKTLSFEKLNHRLEVNSWSILECIAHLNIYGEFYIPEIKTKIAASNTVAKANFTSGILGNYFAESMLPKEKLNKMKTFKDKNPMGSVLDKSTLDCFIHQQEEILGLLEISKKVDLGKIKTAISISKWIKLRLGDTFRVVVYHNDRHIAQANKIAGVYIRIKKEDRF